MNRLNTARLTVFFAALVCGHAAMANCFNSGTVYCDGVVRNVYVASGQVYVSLGNAIGGALGCGTVPAPVGAAASEYVVISPTSLQYAEKYQAVLVAQASSSNVLVYLVPGVGGACTLSGILVLH
jgi:hypothetical protein